jgi:hypothetical protein
VVDFAVRLCRSEGRQERDPEERNDERESHRCPTGGQQPKISLIINGGGIRVKWMLSRKIALFSQNW